MRVPTFGGFSLTLHFFIQNDRDRCSLANEQLDLSEIISKHANSLRRAICAACIGRGFPVTCLNCNLRSRVVAFLFDAIKHIASARKVIRGVPRFWVAESERTGLPPSKYDFAVTFVSMVACRVGGRSTAAIGC